MIKLMTCKGLFTYIQIQPGITDSNPATLDEVLSPTEVKSFNKSQIKLLIIFEDQANKFILPTPPKENMGKGTSERAPQIPPARSDDKVLTTLQALPRVGP